jgi:quercetin dioxygenase-like cupin family protein
MPLFSWDSVKKEMLSERLGRKVINGEKATLAQVFLAKGAVIPKHQHESEEMGYQLEGTAKVELEGKEVIVHKDEVMHVPSNVPHSVVAVEDCVMLYVFSPIRQDWLDGKDDYLRQ